ncbi:hypothetical protein AMTRI_Chr01g136260 [Amborella trichopoda]
MGKKGADDPKSVLIAEICSIFSASLSSCKHSKAPIIPFDCYLLLGVDEKAGVDIIRKNYLRRALQLHPDKNKHPKAEFAFKLVLEAYACLSDETKRKTFDLERCKSACKYCLNQTQQSNRTPHDSPTNFFATEGPINLNLARAKLWRSGEGPPLSKKECRERVRKSLEREVQVIQNSLRAYRVPGRESPLFDPSRLLFPDYPYCRSSTNIKKGRPHFLEREFWHMIGKNNRNRREKPDSPIFEGGPQNRSMGLRTSCNPNSSWEHLKGSHVLYDLQSSCPQA